jgi:DNA-binding beta-propeller fold protein YncE
MKTHAQRCTRPALPDPCSITNQVGAGLFVSRWLRQMAIAASPFLSTLLWVLAGALGAGAALADEHERESGAVKLLATIPIPGDPMIIFDISWVDPNTQLYYLADRSNAGVDVIDAKRNQFVKRIPGGFKGFTGSNATSGPDGVVVNGNWLFVTDAPSRVVSIDLRTDQVVDSISTGGGADPKTGLGFRADELAYDPEDGILLVVNNADSPPFATLIGAQNGQLTILKKILLSSATNGAEQPVWDGATGKFYLSIPEVNGNGGSGPDGAIARINPHTGALEQMFPVKFCQPAGLALGPKQDLLVGCSVVFDTAGEAWSAADKNSAKPISIIMDARTGSIDKTVKGISGSDEVWFNPGDRRYYLAARSDPLGPVLGVIDAESQTLIQLVPTFNQAPGTAHSVAVNPHNNHAFVALPANSAVPNCLNGCVAVFGAPKETRGDDD